MKKFLSTPSARRATYSWAIYCLIDNHFYPRPPRGGRRRTLRSRCRPAYFYPRPPRGGRRTTTSSGNCGCQFLSTPSARRATDVVIQPQLVHSISIHALREEGDAPSAMFTGSCAYFYPRPPRGGRPGSFLASSRHFNISIHALREEGDWNLRRCSRMTENFYPRPPRGGRPVMQLEWCRLLQFLSTPSARRATARCTHPV